MSDRDQGRWLMPVRAHVRPGEALVQITDREPDGFGRMQFTVFWLGHTPHVEPGPHHGVRGQVFHARLDDFIAERARRGQTVRLWSLTGAAAGPLAALGDRATAWRDERAALPDRDYNADASASHHLRGAELLGDLISLLDLGSIPRSTRWH
jgi:hypothetical protein